ncbi:4Fe-4S binding protein [Salipiger sp. 1_MG-2023]|uniref:4Fe-4S binding protein n=1 Tax=Salipiger sp. 1_MG-2023 TaxID=3062665 RepID=UPI0026E13F20|nr:4Fe-4S binding protein [Salipiger sp. 1_MG-2023]MDO6584690.1 4Fe-4S binding protein [Salipiger sp. 1_MG-2023]
MAKTLITCDCLGSQSIDAAALAQATGLDVRPPCSALCTSQIDRAAKALSGESGEDVVLCCTQESRRFEDLAEDLGLAPPALLDLRDRAGWSADPAPKLAKMSALAAEALLPAPMGRMMDVTSHGACLVLGAPEDALPAADQLSDFLAVTVLLDSGAEIPDAPGYDVITGALRRATGALGAFVIAIDALQTVEPGGRIPTLTAPKDGARSQCDVIVDLRRAPPLFPAHEKREGYLRADPGRPAAVSAAVLAASHLVGTFEKPLYIRADPLLCAHSRAGQTGCTRCLDLCPTGAITPDGDHVTIDPLICAGCGACSSACPAGAVSYDAPPVDLTLRRVQTLASAYLEAGGVAPRLLVHDAYGAEMIRLAARHGRGLPADVIPMELPVIGAFGHAEALAARAAGFAAVTLLPGPGADRDALAAQTALASAMTGGIDILDTPDPDALSEALYAAEPPAPSHAPVRPIGSRRQVARQAARALNPEGGTLPLPTGAPYGAVLVDTDACTLCLSCVSLCPSGALLDNPDLPQLRFQEDACLQCGLCATICPEDAITLDPRMNLDPSALSQEVLNEEEPFACVECGTLFGVKSTIDRITDKLRDHAMFDGDKLRMIQMCDDCRVNAQYHSAGNPLAGRERPRPRTTDDYLSKRRDH